MNIIKPCIKVDNPLAVLHIKVSTDTNNHNSFMTKQILPCKRAIFIGHFCAF